MAKKTLKSARHQRGREARSAVRIGRRSGHWTSLLCALGLTLAQPASGREFENVLLISVDTLRADQLGCYGAPRANTPQIDKLAARGVRFDRAVAPTPLTLPSHASLLTGLDPPAHGLRDNSAFRLAPGVTTLPEVLARNGYSTAAFIAALPLDSRSGLGQGFEVYDDALPRATDERAGTAIPERAAVEVVDSSLRWLRTQKQSNWFAFVHLFDPHFPYRPPERFRGSTLQEQYAGEVAYVDEQVGRILAFLEEAGLEETTLVVLTADHGESLGEHRELTHGIFAYESTLHVPLVIAPLEPRVVSTRVRLVDVAPTILDLLGLSFADPIGGRSLRPHIERRPEEAVSPEPSYFEALAMYLNLQWAPLRGFYDGSYKYIDLPLPELYDLSSDAEEDENLCGSRASCREWAERLRAFAGPFEPVAPTEPVDQSTQRQLQALGYLSGGYTAQVRSQFGPEHDPKNLIGVFNRTNAAIAYHARGAHDRALAILDSIIDQHPTYSIAYLKSAAILEAIGRPEQAIEVLQRALESGAGTVFVQRDLGLLFVRMGEPREGLGYLRQAVQAAPERLDLLYSLGTAYLNARDLGRAEQVFRRALGLDASWTEGRTQLGTVYLMQERWSEAIGEFSAAVAADPGLASAHTGLGLAYAGNGNSERAVASWEQALDVDRRQFRALFHLGLIYLDGGRLDRAVPLLEEFVKTAPPERYGRELAQVRSLLTRVRG